MDGDRTSQALARIDAALARIESGARAVTGLRQGADELARLQVRHARLREAVSDGLQQLDQLIDGGQG